MKGVPMTNTAFSFSDTAQVGEPMTHRGIVILPLFPRLSPAAEYITLDTALPQGFVIEEVGKDGSVPDLVVENPLEELVLLYDGEELVGAKQNRILNVSVLVDARSSLTIPVSCVEEGRWSRMSARFGAAGHTAHPELRRRKAESQALRPLARGVAQGEVWDAVREKAIRMRVASPTQANSDTFQAFATELLFLEDAFPIAPGQSGAVLAIGGELCLDWVSRPDAFAQLWPKLRRGYVLDALEALDREPTSREQILEFTETLERSPVTSGHSPGIGCDVRLNGQSVVGSGLELDGELIQLSAFTSGHGPRTGRMARPTQRRP